MIDVKVGVEFEQDGLRGEHLEQQLIGGLVEVVEIVGGEVGLEEYSHDEAFLHLLPLRVGLLQIVNRHDYKLAKIIQWHNTSML